MKEKAMSNVHPQSIVAPTPKRKRTERGAMSTARVLALASAFVLAGLAIVPGSAQAAIKCHKGYQKVSGSYLATPFCQDKYLAQVAREYGMRYSANTIRNNPNIKRNVCRLVGQDIRVHDNCVTVTPRPRGRF